MVYEFYNFNLNIIIKISLENKRRNLCTVLIFHFNFYIIKLFEKLDVLTMKNDLF